MSNQSIKSQLSADWILNPVLHNYALNVVGIDDSLSESELENAFYYLTLWLKKNLSDEDIEEMQYDAAQCNGTLTVFRHMINRMEFAHCLPMENLDKLAKCETLAGGPDLF